MKFWNNRKGNIAVMTALTLPVLVGGAGVGVETGYWYYEQLHLQQAADAAAYAAALELRAGSTEDVMETEAQKVAVANGFDPDNGSLTITSPSTSGTDETHSVDAELTQAIPRTFSALFGNEPITLKVKTTAAYSSAANACVLALDKSASPAISFSGNARAEMDGCVIMADSLAQQSIIFDGNSNVTAPCILTVGNYLKKSNATFQITTCASIQTGQPPAGDPYQSIAYPSCSTYLTSGTAPGCYKSLSVKANSTATFSGVYVIDGGTFKINANAQVSGTDATFILLNGATVDFNGNATIQLTAPTSGAYKGMLFMGSRTSAAGGMSTFNGNASSYLTGVLYFPKQDITYSGNFSGNHGCTQIVANTIVWTGNTRFSVDCSAEGLEPIHAGGSVYLIG